MAIFGDSFTVTVNTVPHTFTYIGPNPSGIGSEYRELNVDDAVAMKLLTARDFGKKRKRFLFSLSRPETNATTGEVTQHTRNTTLVFNEGGSVSVTNELGDVLLAIMAKSEVDNAAKGVY